MTSTRIRGSQKKGIMTQLLQQEVQVKGPEMAFRASMNSYYANNKSNNCVHGRLF